MSKRSDFAPGLDVPRNDYGLILADPPWSYSVFSDKGKDRSAEKHYDTMTVGEIARIPVASVAAKDCHLMMWVTGPEMARGGHVKVMEGWGFRPSALAFVWLKNKIGTKAPIILNEPLTESAFVKGMGHTTRQNAEYVVLGRRGSPRRISKAVHQVIIEPRREHSRKPDQIYDRCEEYATGPYLEMFARQPRAGWDCWGNQTDKFEAAA